MDSSETKNIMLKFYSDTKIYVPCPAGVVTGGAELLHQLVDYLRNHNRDAYIVYFGSSNHIVPDDYKCYNIALSDCIDDNDHNIEVIYEGIFNTVLDRKYAQKVLWWLSVDHFYIYSKPFLSPFDYMKYDKKYGLRMLVKMLLHLCIGKNDFKNRLSVAQLASMEAINAYQSEYAQDFLQKHRFPNVLPLKDYINTDHCKDFDKSIKEDIVLYNPKKGMEFTSQLINAAPDIKWVPLQGMSREQLIEVLKKAKIYVDFGYHPGKDRLPRECAMNGCCVITGKRGSAAFFEDVSVTEKFKFDERTAKITDIISTIRWAIENYDTAIDDYQYYRVSIAYEKEEFEAQIRKLFLIEQS